MKKMIGLGAAAIALSLTGCGHSEKHYCELAMDIRVDNQTIPVNYNWQCAQHLSGFSAANGEFVWRWAAPSDSSRTILKRYGNDGLLIVSTPDCSEPPQVCRPPSWPHIRFYRSVSTPSDFEELETSQALGIIRRNFTEVRSPKVNQVPDKELREIAESIGWSESFRLP